MTKSTLRVEQFPGLKSRKVEASFSGGAVTSEGGSLLLRSVDKKLGLLRKLSRVLPDGRQGGKVAHELVSLLRQRVYGIALGYEDLNDHASLRRDPGFQTAVNRDSELASSATLCRLAGWCERHNVHYCVGIAKNSRLLGTAKSATDAAEKAFDQTQEKQRLFSEVCYAAEAWDKGRRIIVKAEHSELGTNPRFVVTNLDAMPEYVYDKIYCARGEMENRVKEQQLGLFADRTSCHKWWANQFRLLLSSLAYMLIEGIRRLALTNTELAKAQASTIRLKLLKIGAVVTRNTRRIRFSLASGYPYQDIFWQVVKRLNTA